MADIFISRPFRRPPLGDDNTTDVTIGASSTSGDYLELRWTTGVGLTRADIVKFCEGTIMKLMFEGGKDRAGTGVPPT